MEFVRKITQDDFVIITNRLRMGFTLIFYRDTEPSVMESFRIPIQSGKIKVTLFKNGTLLVRGDAKTPEFQAVLETVSDVLDNH